MTPADVNFRTQAQSLQQDYRVFCAFELDWKHGICFELILHHYAVYALDYTSR